MVSESAWAARYDAWLLIKFMPKDVVFSFLSFLIGSRLLTSEWAPYLSRSAIFLLSCSGSPQLFMLPRIASSSPATNLFVILFSFQIAILLKNTLTTSEKSCSAFCQVCVLHRKDFCNTLHTVHTAFIGLVTVSRKEVLIPSTDTKTL